jgi:hypothetical protein
MKKPVGFHKHHVIPKHAGGTDDKSNIIYLSPLDHAKAHLNRFNLYKNPNDAHAYNFLIRNIDKNGNFISGFQGRSHSDLTKEKMSKTRIGMTIGNKNPMYGKSGKNSPVSIPVKHNGLVFDSITALAKFLKKPIKTIHNRIKNNPVKWGYEVLA